MKRKTTDQFINESIEIHGDKYVLIIKNIQHLNLEFNIMK